MLQRPIIDGGYRKQVGSKRCRIDIPRNEAKHFLKKLPRKLLKEDLGRSIFAIIKNWIIV